MSLWNERHQPGNQFGEMDRRHPPDQLMFDLTVIVSQNVTLSDDRPSGDLWMPGLQLIRHVPGGLANDLQLTFDSAPEQQVGLVIREVFSDMNCWIARAASSMSHRAAASVGGFGIDHLPRAHDLVSSKWIA
jgi:hypothetical protein